MKYFTHEWFQALCNALNKDSEFKADTAYFETTILNQCTDKNTCFLLTIRNGFVSVKSATPSTPAQMKISGIYKDLADAQNGKGLQKQYLEGKITVDRPFWELMGLRSKLQRMEDIGRTIPTEF